MAAKPPISSVIPPLILGTATFNFQYVSSPADLPATKIVSTALNLGIRAFDTSPYYGPSEILLGEALHTLAPARESIVLITKAGRVASNHFDYSASTIRASVLRSLERLHTDYLDLVYAHDAEFVSPAEVLEAVTELRRLRDEGKIRYVGISGYPVPVLQSLAAHILAETAESLDAVLSYGNYCVQNKTLGDDGSLAAFRAAGVRVVPNASILNMGLLTTRGVDASPMASWHPSPPELRRACQALVPIAKAAGRSLEDVAIRWSMHAWAERGSEFGVDNVFGRQAPHKIGPTVVGVSTVEELQHTWDIWVEVMRSLGITAAPEDSNGSASAEARRTVLETTEVVESKMWPSLGSWKDYNWESPDSGFVNAKP